MIKRTISSLIFLLSGSSVFAQLSEGTKIGVATGRGLDVPSSSVFWNTPSDASDVVGKFYADSVWRTTYIELNKEIPQFGGWSSKLSALMTRYNILNDELEVLLESEKKDVRVIKGSYLMNFTIKESSDDSLLFVRAGKVGQENNLPGFFAVLFSGKLTLMKYYRAKIAKPSYNAGFGVGDKNTVVTVVSDYYVMSNGSTEKITPGKKTLLALMKDQQTHLEDFIRSKRINFKNEDDLIALFKEYNRL
jgi:hypothetical protein